MIYVDDIQITPAQMITGQPFTIEVALHEEYENAKRYENRYPHRYGEKGEEK
ncbi:MAG TPA: hypothetical protein H9722_00915 [Candidatus Mediterraneibacter pullistercoris]|nr:hypothetical protein [Candidatus Mediterraneibacter pullistercoris]